MHTFSFITVLGACIATVAAAAVPVRRGEFVNTVTQIDIVTEYITATVWVDPPSSTDATTTSTTIPTPASTTAVVTPTTSSTSTTSTSTSTSVYVAPAAATPEVNQPAAVVQTAASTPTTTSTTPAAAAATTQQSSASSSSGGSKVYTGDVTYYDVGLGSCGITNTDSEMVLAMAKGVMNKATMCGKTITISYGGSTHTGTVVDTCMGCEDGAIDLSPALFKAVVPNGNGRVHGVEWWFN